MSHTHLWHERRRGANTSQLQTPPMKAAFTLGNSGDLGASPPPEQKPAGHQRDCCGRDSASGVFQCARLSIFAD
jgi:hypothetical protein